MGSGHNYKAQIFADLQKFLGIGPAAGAFWGGLSFLPFYEKN